MTKESKNIISRETCKKELKHLAKADLYSDAVLLAVFLLIFVPLIFVGIYLLKPFIIVGIICIVGFATIPLLFVYKLIKNIMTVRLINRDGFSIVKDTVCRLVEDEPIGRRNTADVIYFGKHGKYIPSQTVFDLTSIGDVFYLVVLHTKKKEPVFAFHTMMYECKDFD